MEGGVSPEAVAEKMGGKVGSAFPWPWLGYIRGQRVAVGAEFLSGKKGQGHLNWGGRSENRPHQQSEHVRKKISPLSHALPSRRMW